MNTKIKQLKVKGITYDIDVVKDWDQNDPSAVDFIKNKTHGKNIKTTYTSISGTNYHLYSSSDPVTLYRAEGYPVIPESLCEQCSLYKIENADLSKITSLADITIVEDSEISKNSTSTAYKLLALGTRQYLDPSFDPTWYCEDFNNKLVVIVYEPNTQIFTEHFPDGGDSGYYYCADIEEPGLYVTNKISLIDVPITETEFIKLDRQYLPEDVAYEADLQTIRDNLAAAELYLGESIYNNTEWVKQEAQNYTDYAVSNIVTTKDWNQNDSSAKDYIKNRTHYEYEELVEKELYVFYPEDKVPNSDLGYWVQTVDIDANDYYDSTLTFALRSSSGSQTIYKTSAKGSSMGSIFGNPSIVDEFHTNSGEPFLFVGNEFYCTGYCVEVLILNNETDKLVKQLDEKFIPDTVARKSDVETAVNSLVDTAPETLNTLNELSKALGDDPNFATTILTEVGKKVDKVNGKGLSTNDYTTTEKNKLAGIEIGAEKNVQPDWDQYDETAPDYVKNRTHGTIKKLSRVMASWDNDRDTLDAFVIEECVGDSFVLEIYDGSTMSGILKKSDDDLRSRGGPDYYIGNIYWARDYIGDGEDLGDDSSSYNTGEDFCVWIDQKNLPGATIFWRDTDKLSYVDPYNIYRITTAITQLDEQYIPDTIARTSAINDLQNNFIESSANSLELKPLLVKDLNLATEPGFYFFGSSQYVANSPVIAGLLLVFNDNTKSNVERHYQMLFAYKTNKIFFRTVKVGGVYQEWETLHDNTIPDPEPLVSSKLEISNLNYVTTPGSYNLSSEITYENVPDREIAGLLVVYNDTNSPEILTRLYQMFIGYRRGNIFTRHRQTDGTFTEWKNLITDKALFDLKADKDTVMLKDDYLEYAQGNLFDGNFIEGYQVCNPKQGVPFFNYNPDFKYLAIFNVKPNTPYTIEIDNPVLEPLNEFDEETSPQFYYFKAYSATHQLEAGEPFDGEIKCVKTRTPTYRYTVTTGPNDAVIYIQAAKNTDQVPYLQFTEGHYGNYTNLGYGSDTYVFTDKVSLSQTQLQQAADALSADLSDKVIEDVTAMLNSEVIPEITETVKANLITGAQLFDGVSYLTIEEHGVNYLSGNPPSTSNPDRHYNLGKNTQATSTFVITIAPWKDGETSRDYTIFRSSAAKEYANADGTGSYANYGRFATSEEYLGAITSSNSQGSLPLEARTVITVKPGDNYLYIQTALRARPDVQVVEGNVEELPYGTYYGGAYALEVKPNATAETEKVVVYTQEALDSYISTKFSAGLDESSLVKYNNLAFSKTEDKIVIKKGRAAYELQKITDSSINLNTWRWLGMSVDEQTLFHGPDCEGVVLEQGASDHIGGYHGDEMYTDIQIFVDGELVDETAVITEKICQQVVLLVTSDVYSCASPTTKLFRRIKKLDWKDNTLNVYNTWEHIGSTPIFLNSVKLSGMLSVECSCLKGYAGNVITPNESYDAYTMPFENYKALSDFTSTGFNKDLNEVTLYGRTGYSIRMKSFDKDQVNYGGRMMAYDFDPSVSLDEGRLKVYLESHQAVSSTAEGYEILPGEVLRGHFEISVNSQTVLSADRGIIVGNTTITEAQLQKMLRLLDSIQEE